MPSAALACKFKRGAPPSIHLTSGDQCKKAGTPFFFKQWGDFNEEGAPQKEKKDGGAKLDGKIHHEDPTPG